MEIRTLNTLRGIACTIVLISHYSNASNIFNGLLGHLAGQLGVMVFFLLSSFLITTLYIDKLPNKINIHNYIVSRAARILPLFILVIMISCLIHLLFPKNISGVFYPINSPKVLLEHLFFLRGVSVFWSIPPEVQFYLIFIVFWLAYYCSKTLAAILILSIIIFFFFGPQMMPHHSLKIVFGMKLELKITEVFPYFCAGILFGMIHKRFKLPNLFKSHYFAVSLLVLPILFPRVLFALFHVNLSNEWNNIYVYLAVCSVFFANVFLVPSNNIFLENKLGDFLGKISFSVYLLHMPILLVLKKLGLLTGITGWLLFFPLVLLISFVVFTVFENPSREYIRKILIKKKSLDQSVPFDASDNLTKSLP